MTETLTAKTDNLSLEKPEIDAFSGYRIEPLISTIAKQTNFKLASCLDVGCGSRPMKSWFEKFSAADRPTYIGAETDEEILAYLAKQGVEAVNPFTTKRDLASDFVLAMEVIEHIKPADSASFFEFCARNTKKMFALTTPNFEYWQNLKATGDTTGCRWVPDHFKDFRPNSTNSHHHKQEMTPELVLSYLSVAFPKPNWEYRVFRAWPWSISDLAQDKNWTLYFKIFAFAWRVAEE
ncbi:MAG: hypothetical protein MUE44_08015 [Oscillatoriaceae cyanobacterium Prado104]|jgi:2-polyprenyl-3-methyl-5-hydroxy-6-metoxy-1,4-benzoquinol methylase|nr:hypothetical protein [Oscillatoriaceae cyanobacterium Prado104]